MKDSLRTLSKDFKSSKEKYKKFKQKKYVKN